MEKTDKKYLDELNLEEARGWVIDCLQRIEYIIDKMIMDYFHPNDKKKFHQIVLNSSIIDFGGKLKILKNICNIDKKIIEKLRKFASIRNGFAHAPDRIHMVKADSTSEFIWKNELRIDVMNSEGLIISKIASEYISEYYDLFYELHDSLWDFQTEWIKSINNTEYSD